MRELGVRSHHRGRVYLTGGASLMVLGLRDSAIDIDFISDDDPVMRVAAALRDELCINVDRERPRFAPPGWEERSPFIARECELSIHHLDWYTHALANLERGHTRDMADMRAMLQHGLVLPHVLRTFLGQVLLDRAAVRRAVESLQ